MLNQMVSCMRCIVLKTFLFCFVYRCTWEELVVKSWKYYRIDLWKKIERLIFKSFDIVCDYVKSLVGKIIVIYIINMWINICENKNINFHNYVIKIHSFNPNPFILHTPIIVGCLCELIFFHIHFMSSIDFKIAHPNNVC
jgi:hypothetical protein